MTRKLVSLLLALAMLLSVCSIATAEDPATITWYGVGATNDHFARINEAASEYIQSQGVNANLELIKLGWGDYLETYQVMLAAHEEFDLFNCMGSTFMQYAINGGVMEITDEMLDNQLSGVKACFNDSLFDALRLNGKLYMVPAMHEWAQYYGFAYYNMDVAEELNLDLTGVKTLDDLDPIFDAVYAAHPDYTILIVDGMELPMTFYQFDTLNHVQNMTLGLDCTAEGAEVVSYYESEQVRSVLRKIDEWSKKGYINTDPTIAAMSLIQTGKVFCNVGRFKPGAGCQFTNSNARFDDMKFDPEAAPLMSMKDCPSGWCTAVSANSSDPETALAVLNMAYTDADLVNLIVYGQKDVDYTLNEGGFVEYIDGGYTSVTANHTWQFGNQNLNLVTKAYADMGLENIWQMQEDFNNAAVPMECTGFFFNTDEVDIEFAALSNVYDEYGTMLWNGTCEDLDATLTEFIDKLYANGLQTVIDEANRQYAEFLANK